MVPSMSSATFMPHAPLRVAAARLLPRFELHVAVLVLLTAAARARVVAADLRPDVADRLGLLRLAAGVCGLLLLVRLRLLRLERRDRRRLRRPRARPQRHLRLLVAHLLHSEHRL